MRSTTFCTLGLFATILAVSSATSNPWIDTSLCAPEDTLPMCHYRQQKCSGINRLFTGSMGPIATVLYCANMTNLTPGPDFYMSIGLAFAKGAPEILNDLVTSDPEGTKAIRRCTLSSTGLMNVDGTIGRDVLVSVINSTLTTPEAVSAVTAAAYSCPEPTDFQTTSFIRCLKSACMSSVTVSPSMGSGFPHGGPPPAHYFGGPAAAHYYGGPSAYAHYGGGGPSASSWM